MMELGENELERLLIEKSFEELSFLEKEYILKYLTEEEYTYGHILLSESALSFKLKPLPPAPKVLEELKSTFDERKKINRSSDFSLKNWFKYPLRQSLTAAAALLVVVYWIYFPFFPEKPDEKITAVKAKPKQVQEEISLKNNNIISGRKSSNVLESKDRIVEKRSSASLKKSVPNSNKIIEISELLIPAAYNTDTVYLCYDIPINNDNQYQNALAINSRIILPDSKIDVDEP